MEEELQEEGEHCILKFFSIFLLWKYNHWFLWLNCIHLNAKINKVYINKSSEQQEREEAQVLEEEESLEEQL